MWTNTLQQETAVGAGRSTFAVDVASRCLLRFFGLASRMFKLPAIFLRKRAAAEQSDFERRFGWFIERGGTRIGELDYLRWDSAAQFWHEYRLSWRSPSDAVIGPEAWIASKVMLRNRRYADAVVDSFLISAERGNGVIAVRGAHVTEERIRHDDEA